MATARLSAGARVLAATAFGTLAVPNVATANARASSSELEAPRDVGSTHDVSPASDGGHDAAFARDAVRGGAPYALRQRFGVDIAVTAVGLSALIASNVFKSSLGGSDCEWCDRNPDGTDDLNGLDAAVRRSFRWSDPRAAGRASDWAGTLLSPMVAVGLNAFAAAHAGVAPNTLGDALMVAEATVLAADVNLLVKLMAGRPRPYAHARPVGAPSSPDDNLSFYSGHASMAFALATSSGTVASLRGYRDAPWIWGAGLTVAVATGYLRIAADQHYLLDVAAGAAMGSAIGIAVPRLLHGRLAQTPARAPETTLALLPTSNPIGAAGRLSW